MLRSIPLTARFSLAALIASLSCLVSGHAESPAEPPAEVAGRTVEQYAEALSDSDRVVRLRAAKSLGAFGAAAGGPLRKALVHDDPAVRYTAAAHLGRIAGEPLEAATERLQELAGDESSPAVQMAASFALCRSGKTAMQNHLPLLVERLDYPERAMACSAAMLIGDLGPAATAAIEPLQKTYDANRPGSSGDYHLGGAAKNALRKIQPQ